MEERAWWTALAAFAVWWGFADGHTLGGSSSGSWSQGSAGVEWAGSFTATRE